jgi:hypothetical protein
MPGATNLVNQLLVNGVTGKVPRRTDRPAVREYIVPPRKCLRGAPITKELRVRRGRCVTLFASCTTGNLNNRLSDPAFNPGKPPPPG